VLFKTFFTHNTDDHFLNPYYHPCGYI